MYFPCIKYSSLKNHEISCEKERKNKKTVLQNCVEAYPAEHTKTFPQENL